MTKPVAQAEVRKRAGMQSRGVMANASWNSLATLCNIVITFFLTPVLIRQLGTDQFGLLLLVWSVTGVLGIANFGVGEATLRFVAHYHADGDMAAVNRVMGATLTFYFSVCTAITGVVFLATPAVASLVKAPANGPYQVESLLRLSALLFSLGMISNAFRSVPMALQRYDISSRIGVGQHLTRSLGLIVLALAGMSVLHMVVWDVVVAFTLLAVQLAVARWMLPGVRWTPSMSFSGMREIFGYSVFSFLTHIFLTIYREGGKLILGNRVGPAGVAYLGTPDSVANRLHSVVVSGIETLMPRFSASRDPEGKKALLVTTTWFAMACGVVLYLPLAVLMPDFLRLWINPVFARDSALVGQLLALSFIAPTAFAPTATLFRGMGKPGFVTAVMALAGSVVLGTTLLLVSSHGALAVGAGYLISSTAWLGGIAAGWLQWMGRPSLRLLWRTCGFPMLLGCGLGATEFFLRNGMGGLGWGGLFVVGGAFAFVNALVLFAADRLVGGDSPAGHILGKVLESERLASLLRRIGMPAGPVAVPRQNGLES